MFAKLKKKIEEEQQDNFQRSPFFSTCSVFTGIGNSSSTNEPPTVPKISLPQSYGPECQSKENAPQQRDVTVRDFQQDAVHIRMLESQVKELMEQLAVERKFSFLLQMELQQSTQSHEQRDQELQSRIQSLLKEQSKSDQSLHDCQIKLDMLTEVQNGNEEINNLQALELMKIKQLLRVSQREYQVSEDELKRCNAESVSLHNRVKFLESEQQRLKEELLHSQLSLSQQSTLQEEMDRLGQDILKSKNCLEAKDMTIQHLQDQVATLEKRLSNAELCGDEHVQAVTKERCVLEKKLEESFQHLSDIKITWSEKIFNLEAQILNLNKKTAEDSEEIRSLEGQVIALKQTLGKLEEENQVLNSQLQDDSQ